MFISIAVVVVLAVVPAVDCLAAGVPVVEGRVENGDLLEVGAFVEVPAEGWRGAERARSLLRVATVRSITYASDGLKVRGYLATPKSPGPHPAVIFNRGGNREFGAFDDEGAVHVLATLASWGYVAIASQYRGNDGGGGQEEFGGADVDDVLNLIPVLEHLPEVDAGRIGMIGWSRGGMMTYLALARTDRIRAAVIGGGIADVGALIRDRPEMEQELRELVPDFEVDRETQLVARSAIRWPEKLNVGTPLLLLHGTSDWRVAPEQSLDMAAALLAKKRAFRLILYEGGDHMLTEYRPEVEKVERAWLDFYVRDLKAHPSLEPHGQ